MIFLPADRAADLVAQWLTDPLNRFAKQQRTREMIARALARRAQPDHLVLASQAENAVAGKLIALGYQVEATGFNDHEDLLINRVLKVEVKASLWRICGDKTRTRQRGRYQFNIRPKQAGADLIILVARNGLDHFFVIPAAQLAGRQSITIRCYNPAAYTGQWAKYRERWGLIAPALANVSERTTRQLELAV